MKLKRNLVLAVLCLSTVTTFGQSEPQSSRIKEPEKITFKPHWFIQAQLGLSLIHIFAADRIVTDFKGDTVQPNTNPTENRVSICVVE